jgi:hypothetical protein
MPAHREQHDVGVGALAGRQRRAQSGVRFFELRERGIHRELDAEALGLDMQVRTQVVIEAAQHSVPAMHDPRLATEAVEDVRELEGDVAPADDEQTAG